MSPLPDDMLARLAVAEIGTHGMPASHAAREMMRAIGAEQRGIGQLVPTSPAGYELAARWWEWSAQDTKIPEQHLTSAEDLRARSPNNCIGCVKARDHLNYWKRVRKHFPEVFARRAAQERKLGVAINRVTRDGVRSPIYLDEIPPGDPTGPDSVKISCGLFCMAEADNLT